MLSSDRIRIKVKLINGDIFDLILKKGDAVLDIKNKIKEIKDIPITTQKLIFRGKVLKNEELIMFHKIEDNDVIHLIIVAPGTANQSVQNEGRNNRNTVSNSNNSFMALFSQLNESMNNLRVIQNRLFNNNRNNVNNNIVNNINNRIINISEIEISDSFKHLLTPSNFNIYNSLENISQNINNIDIIINVENKLLENNSNLNTINKLFCINNTFNDTYINYQIGQWVDVKDPFMSWSEAQIIDINYNENKGLIHYIGWSSNLNEWIPLQSNRIALFRTHTIQSPYSRYLSPYPNHTYDISLLSTSNTDDYFKWLTTILKYIQIIENKLKILVEQSNIFKNIKNMPIKDRYIFEKSFYIQLMQFYPFLDRIGRIMTDYAMFIMNLCFKNFNENHSNYESNINILSNNGWSDNDNNNILRQKINQFEKFANISVLRNNGEVAQSFLSPNNGINTNNSGVNNIGGANFQRQVNNNNFNNNLNNNFNNNQRIINPISNTNNNRQITIDYLNCLTIPSTTRKKFSSEPKIVKLEKFSIFHYNKVPIIKINELTQTFDKFMDLEIVNKQLNIEIHPIKKIIQHRKPTEKIVLDASKILPINQIRTKTNGQNVLKLSSVSKIKTKYKLNKK